MRYEIPITLNEEFETASFDCPLCGNHYVHEFPVRWVRRFDSAPQLSLDPEAIVSAHIFGEKDFEFTCQGCIHLNADMILESLDNQTAVLHPYRSEAVR